ncbi:putative GMC oxidoreductase [Rosellinia necatrix]|uniref:Putative GMC oxidoreductase n=1 Tax=Rosellinia necatrix TaxID=77044 RepID=A0A1S7UMC4_ROSNE|nr:putative GMC oxidoreductase [Rosellinia necatrix]
MSESFDYVVVGGGTSGLVVAARLTEDANVRVVVIEAGADKRTDPALETPGLVAGAYADDRFIWPFQSTPQAELNGRHLRQDTGKVLGGSSLTNFMMAMFPSRTNLDTWGKMGNKGWSFDDLAPYFRKFSTSHPPSQAIRETLGGLGYYREDLAGDGPVQLSFDDQYSVMNENWFKTFAELGLEMKTDPRTGKAIGAFQNSSTIESGNNTRSSAATAYYTDEIAKRPNLKVLTETTVQKINTETRKGLVVATGVEVKDKDGKVTNITAKNEVVLAAGTIRTPQLLELSGIGDRDLLEGLGIEVLIDNPNVGEHMQDHLMTSQQFPVKKGYPSADGLREPARFQSAFEQYASTKQGPLAGMGTSVAYVPLADRGGVMTQADRKALFDKYLSGGGPALSPVQKREFKLIRELLETEEEPAIQYLCFPGSLTVTPHPDTLTDMFTSHAPYDCIGIMALLNHPFSRGSVHVSSRDVSVPPTWNPNYCTHPLDLEILARTVGFVERIVNTAPYKDMVDPALKRLPDATGDDLETAKEIVRGRTVSCFHIAGTCRMLPRELGGVLDERLVVHGTSNLRVVDASMIPLEPLGNIQTTVYAVAERAADFIKESRKADGISLPIR